jgi:hypothetical protein
MLSSMWICCEYCIISLIIAEEKPKPTSIYNCTFTVENYVHGFRCLGKHVIGSLPSGNLVEFGINLCKEIQYYTYIRSGFKSRGFIGKRKALRDLQFGQSFINRKQRVGPRRLS